MSSVNQFLIISMYTLGILTTTVATSYSAANYELLSQVPKIGIWNVNANANFAYNAGSKLGRRMWRLSDYKIENGQVIPKSLSANLYLKKAEVIGTMAGPLPAWIQPDIRTTNKIYPPTNWKLFDTLIRRWLQDVPDFPDYFEVFNELDAHWTGSVTDYQRFQSIITKAIRDIYPKTKILGPSSYDADLVRLKKYMAPQFIEQFDGIVLHAYVNGTRPENEFIERIRQMKDYLKQIGFPNKPIYITEFGWTTGTGTWQQPVNELTQAQYVARSILLLASEKVEGIVYFCLFYDAKNLGEREFSLLNKDMTPKPAYLAFKFITQSLNEANGIRAGRKDSIYYVVIQKPKTTVLALWAPDGPNSITLPLTRVSFKLFDFMGKSLTKATSSIAVNANPVFVEFSNRLDDIRL